MKKIRHRESVKLFPKDGSNGIKVTYTTYTEKSKIAPDATIECLDCGSKLVIADFGNGLLSINDVLISKDVLDKIIRFIGT